MIKCWYKIKFVSRCINNQSKKRNKFSFKEETETWIFRFGRDPKMSRMKGKRHTLRHVLAIFDSQSIFLFLINYTNVRKEWKHFCKLLGLGSFTYYIHPGKKYTWVKTTYQPSGNWTLFQYDSWNRKLIKYLG